MDTNALILIVITTINSILTLLASGLKYSTRNVSENAAPNKLGKRNSSNKILFFAKPWWVRSVSGSIALFLLYMLNQSYSSGSPPTTHIAFYIDMLFALLIMNIFSYVLFEVSLRASNWIEQQLLSKAKDFRNEYHLADDEVKESIRVVSHKLDEVSELTNKLRDRARKQDPLGLHGSNDL